MRHVSLSTVVAALESGKRPKGGVTSDSGTIPSLGGEHLNRDGGFRLDSLKYIDELFFASLRKGAIKKNDILIVKDGATTGKVSYVGSDFPFEMAAINEHLFALTVNTAVAEPRYVFAFLRSPQGQMEILKDFRGAAIGGISRGFIELAKIPLPELNDQIRIAHLLGKVESLIAQRKQHLQQLDDLLKSVFLNMFGDAITSGSNTTLGEYITTLSDYHANGSYETLKAHVELLTKPNYALMVRTTDLENKNFSSECNYIAKEAYEFLEKSKVYGDEIIVNKIGSAGKVYLMPNLGRPVSLGMNAFLLRFDERLNKIFAYYFLTSDVGKQRIQKLVKGAVTKTITKDAIRSIAISVIPTDRQNKFAVVVEAVQGVKTLMQKSQIDLTSLYGVLSQQAFNGELDLSRVPHSANS